MKNRHETQQTPGSGAARYEGNPYNFESPEHPSLEEIGAYRNGSLSGEQAGRVQDHLVDCEQCRDLFLIGGEPPAREAGVLDFEKEMIWARLKATRAEDEAGEARRRAEAARRTTWRERLGVAAAVLAVLVPLGGFSYRQSTVVAEQTSVITDLTSPQLNVAIHDVLEHDHRGPDRGDADEHDSMTFTIPAGTEFFTIVFPVGKPDGARYRVELFDGEEQLIWTGDGLEVDEFGYATLGLSRRFLAEGSYRIRVYDSNSDLESIGDHSITIRYLR